MRRLTLAAILTFVSISAVHAQDSALDPLFDRLIRVSSDDAPLIEEKIIAEWSKSGSAAMDLLVLRGRRAMAADQYDVAVQHFSALTDHAPDFAEGWHLLATVYYRQGRYGPALDALERALHLEPRHFSAMFGLVLILDENDQHDQALKVARMITDIHPHYARLGQIMGRLQRLSTEQDT